jgi:hypothetical protein
MKILGLFATAAVLATTPLAAQTVVRRTVTVQHSEHRGGPVIARHRRKVCTTRWYHHRKVRNCRWVR